MFYYILPPIIFSEGLNIKRRRFLYNLGQILLHGIAGTLITFILIGVGAYLLDINGMERHPDGSTESLSLKEIFLLAAALSTTDSAFVVELLGEELYPDLCTLFLGQAITNEAVSILLFTTVETSP